MGDTIRKGIIEAKVIIPTQPEESDLSKTNQALATISVHMEAPEHMLAIHVFRKSRCFKAEKWGRPAKLRAVGSLGNGMVTLVIEVSVGQIRLYQAPFSREPLNLFQLS